MVTAVGGTALELTLKGRSFAPDSDADFERAFAGFENEVLSNGDGTARLIKRRKVAQVTGVVVKCDDFGSDHEYIQGLANENDFFPITVTLASGATYSGEAQIVGELRFNTGTTTAGFDLAFGGDLEKQAS